VKLLVSCTTDRSTATFVAGVSTNVWRRAAFSRHVCLNTCTSYHKLKAEQSSFATLYQ